MTRSKVFSKVFFIKVFKLQRCLITNHNVSVASAMDNEGVRVFTILESVVYYIDPKSPGSLDFLVLKSVYGYQFQLRIRRWKRLNATS